VCLNAPYYFRKMHHQVQKMYDLRVEALYIYVIIMNYILMSTKNLLNYKLLLLLVFFFCDFDLLRGACEKEGERKR
jgi:hypothetical protein